MYKRKKRRANKGKKKLSIAATTTSSSLRTELSADELESKITGTTTETSDIMSVTTMEVAENHQQQHQQQQPQRQSVEVTTSNNNNSSNSKAVGARKRKPMQISKVGGLEYMCIKFVGTYEPRAGANPIKLN